MSNTTPLRIGQVIQLHPVLTRNQMFAACMMVVTEPKGWGAQGYVQMTGTDGQRGGQAYYRAGWAEIARLTGDEVVFIAGIHPDEEEEAAIGNMKVAP
jgi:hypothetical protein